MFNTLIKRLFPFSRKNQSNFFYFEESKKTAEELKEKMIDDLQSSMTTKAINIESKEERQQKAFYDFLFGQSPPTVQHDELSLFVSKKIAQLLSQPAVILKALPVLPASLTKILEQLNNNDFDTKALVALIQQEPVIAAKVIELSNSSYYNHGEKEISDLKSAFMLLGTNGLIEGVINGFIGSFTPESRVYFQQYGVKIWHHCLTTGVIAKKLLHASPHKQDAAQGYLIGLICNLGDMIIYQLLTEAFAYVHPDSQPNSFAFKDLMYKNSKVLTYHIAKYWHFPQTILDALALQAKLTRSAMVKPLSEKRPVACFIYEANLISELTMMFEHGDVTENELVEAKNSLLSSDEAKNHLSELLNTDKQNPQTSSSQKQRCQQPS